MYGSRRPFVSVVEVMTGLPPLTGENVKKSLPLVAAW